MGMCDYRGIFLAKVDELLCDIKSVKSYIDDILVLCKDIFENNIDQLRIIFGRLCAASLKVHTPNFSFGLKEITYLGCVMTREGIKHDPKKVQEIIDLSRTSTTTKVRSLIGMVHYYRNMCPKRSHVLDPLTEATSGPKVRKIVK